MGKTKDLGHLAHIVAYDTENHITVPAGITMHTNQLVASQAWVTTELGSYALSSSLSSYVPASRTITINGTTYDLSENRSWDITSMIYPAAGIPLSTGSAWGTSITNNSANWNTAYGWGNHASAGYALSSALSGYVPTSRTITINGTTWDLTANRSFTVTATETDTLATVTARGATTSTALSLSGKVTFSSAVDNRPQVPGGILGLDTGDGNFDIWGISRDYYPSHATAANAWGLRWNGDNNDFEFVGGGTSRVILDMDGGNITATGTLSASGYNKTNWDTAYGWGNHASAGYALSSHNHNGTYWPVEGGWKPASLSGSTRLIGKTSPDGGEFALAYSGGQIHAYTDGFFYQNEGQYRVIDSNSISSQSVNYASSAGSVAWSNVSGRPGWMSAASLIESHSNANEWRNSGFYENGGGGSNWPSATWYNSINVRHSNQGNYHGFQVAMSYYDNNLWFRSYQGSGSFQSWAYAISSQNIGSQTVSKLNPLSGDGNYKLAYTADGARTNAGEWGRAVMYYVPNGQTYGIRVDRADIANSISGQANSATINATSGNAGNNIVLRDGNGDISIGTLNTNHAYFGGGGRGLTSADTYGSYGNVMTYGTGQNGWHGYGIYDNGGNRCFFMSNNGNFGIYGQTIGKWAFYYGNSTASYAIGSDSPVAGYTLYLIYGLYTVGLYNASDARMKKDIKSLSNSLDKVKQLRGVSYEYIDKGEDGTKNKGLELGFIAQEVLPIIPELIRYDEKKGYAMNYNGVSAVLVEAVKEQQVQIEAQQNQIENQQNQINTLISQLTELLNK